MAKHIFVTGGVSSSLGKGITAASLGRLLKQRGLRVCVQKLDPYLNIDPGTMNPFEHGEVFVTFDGGETDLDLGHYERFIDENLPAGGNATTGSIYQTILNAERRGDYLGKTVQVVPHVTDEIKRRILALATDDIDVVITEVGGTVGDIEILPFLEAIRQFRNDVGRDNVCYIHVTLLPFLAPSGELKTKPTQHSVTELRSRGIQPDVIVCRSDREIEDSLRLKISNMCDVPLSAVVSCIDASNLYSVPLVLHDQGLDVYLCNILRIDLTSRPAELESWKALVKRVDNLQGSVRVGLIGKYVELADAYLSVAESLRHAGFHFGVGVKIEFVQAQEITPETVAATMAGFDAIVIPGGFGERGMEGKILSAKWSRENNLACLGICLGMQAMVIDYARSVLGYADANSSEFDEASEHKVIYLMDDQQDVTNKGGTMRLGVYPAKLGAGTKVLQAYGKELVEERHRHRYEVNPAFQNELSDAGLVLSGLSPDGTLVEFVEHPTHPFWIGTQAHPEFLSRPQRPHPLFRSLIGAAIESRDAREPKLIKDSDLDTMLPPDTISGEK